MQVKIYREPENEGLIIDENSLNEYHNLIQKLGLKNETQEQKTPNVYIHINDSMSKILKALCPQVEKAENYNGSTIPVEVLKVLDYAIDNKMFDGYEIWSATKNPDPLLIGWKWQDEEAKEKGYSWRKNIFLIARWGDESLELRELLQKGFTSLKTSLIDSVKEVKSFCDAVISEPDVYVRQHLKQNLNLPRIEINGTSDFGNLPF